MANFRLLVVSTIVDSKGQLIGYLTIDDNADTLARVITLNQLGNVASQVEFINATYNPQYNILEGTKAEGTLTSYPKINIGYTVVANKGMVMYKAIEAKDSNKIIGAVVFSPQGKRVNMSITDIEKQFERGIKPINFSLQMGIIKKLDGSDFPIVKMRERRKVNVYNSDTGYGEALDESEKTVLAEEKDELQEIEVACLQDVRSSEFMSDANQTMLRAKVNMRKVSPYFFAILNTIKCIPAQNFGTLGVTEDKMYYDVQFVASLNVEELTYILIHEMMHIAMQHSIRFGKRKNHDLWNIACDLYINTMISNTFTQEVNGQVIKCTLGADTVHINGGIVKCPNMGIHLGTAQMGAEMDLGKESPESIYKKLEKENPAGAEIVGAPPEFSKVVSTVSSNSNNQGQQSIMQAEIQNMAQELQKINDRLSIEQENLEKQLDSLETIDNANQIALKKADTPAKIKVLTEKCEESKANKNNMQECIDRNSDVQLDIAEVVSKLASGSIKRSTADSLVVQLQGSASTLKDVGYKSYDKNITVAGQEVESIADRLDKLAQMVPSKLDMSQSGDDAQSGGAPIGIVPDEVENAPENQTQSGEGQSGNDSDSNPDSNPQDAQDSDGQSGSDDSQSSSQSGSSQVGSSSNGTTQDKDSGKYGKGTAYSQEVGSDSQDSQGNGSDAGSQQTQGNQGSQSGVNPLDQSQGMNQGTQDMMNGEGKTIKAQQKRVKVKFNGKTLEGVVNMDVMTNNSHKTDEAVKANRESTRAQLTKIKTKIQMEKDKGNISQDGTGQGEGANGYTDREIEFGLSNDISWKRILKNICTTKPKKMYSAAHPNKKLMNTGISLPSQRKIGKQVEIKDIKICIDVSGSVSSEQLNRYLSEVASLLKMGENSVSGELIYWSTDVGSAGDFNKLKDLLKINPNTTGGTDVKCVFRYLNKEIGTLEEPNKREKSNLKDIPLIMIITDGCFSYNYVDYASKFNKKVIWIIDGDARGFQPPFGKVVSLTAN